MRQWMWSIAVVVALLSSTAAVAQARIPQTAEEHFAVAKSYQEKAASFRAIADEHRTMLEEYKRSALPPTKTGMKNPWVKKMEEHCGAYIRDAGKLAADADKLAEYHTMRGRELQGK